MDSKLLEKEAEEARNLDKQQEAQGQMAMLQDIWRQQRL